MVSDKYGRRKALIVAILLAGGSGCIATFVNNRTLFAILRITVGMGGMGCFMVPAVIAGITHTVQNLKKNYLFSLCSPQLVLTRSPQKSGQYKSEAREPEGMVKITYGIVTSSFFKRAGNSN